MTHLSRSIFFLAASLLSYQAAASSWGSRTFLQKFVEDHKTSRTLSQAQAATFYEVKQNVSDFFSGLNARFAEFQGKHFDKVGVYKAYREELMKKFDIESYGAYPQFPVRENEGSILVSLASYRDPNLLQTLKDVVGRAEKPEKIFVGLVQQYCSGADGVCMTGVPDGPHQRAIVGPADMDTEQVFCSDPKFKEWCQTNMRAVKVEEKDSLGPTVARFLAARLYMGETYYMQLDSHMRMAPNWDTQMIQQMKGAASKKPVLSAYPTPGMMEDNVGWVNRPGPRMCGGLFNPPKGGDGGVFRLLGASAVEHEVAARPIPTPWIAAGYFMAPGAFVNEVPFQPLHPWVFMGEELELTARAYTSGWDVFAPNATLLNHYYSRRGQPKFWEIVTRSFKSGGAHNELQSYILQRVKLITGYEHNELEKQGLDRKKLTASDPEFLLGLDGACGLGKERTIEGFLEHVGIDMVNKRSHEPGYCSRRWPKDDNGEWTPEQLKLQGFF